MFFELVLQGQSWIRKLHVINWGLNFKTHFKNNLELKKKKKKDSDKTTTLLLSKTFCYYLEETKMNF